jgi:hypothetical protein
MKSQPMDGASANPNAPRLGIGKALEQPSSGSQAIIANLKFTRLDIDRDNLALMILLDLEPDFGLIERIPPLGKLFFAISGLSGCHRVRPRGDFTTDYSLGKGAIGGFNVSLKFRFTSRRLASASHYYTLTDWCERIVMLRFVTN